MENIQSIFLNKDLQMFKKGIIILKNEQERDNNNEKMF